MTAFRDAARRVLEARLPADDPKWGPWIEGTLDELDTLPGVVLDHREAQTRTDAEKLAKIAALCVPLSEAPERPIRGRDEWEHGFAAGQTALAQTVREILLAKPGPAVPAHDIDRDALVDVAQDAITAIDGPATIGSRAAAVAAVDAILALVRPVEGIVLTPEELAVAKMALPDWATEHTGMPVKARQTAVRLAARLEASS